MNNKFTPKKLVLGGVMLALALVFQIGFASFAQPAVGPLVNMVLFVTAALVSPAIAVIVGCMTPLVAFAVGIMPMMPLVPVIAFGNAILVVGFSFCYYNPKMKFAEYIGVAVGAFFKFVFLATAVRQIVPLFVPKVPGPLVTALSFNQFITAIVGGAIAIVVITALKKVLK